MRRLCITLTLCFLVQAATPPAAHAWLWEYFEELSGPGPFTGWSFEWRVVCFSEPDPANSDAVETDDESKLAAAKLVQFFGPGCFFKQVPVQNRRTASINVKFGFLDAKDNDLQYRSDRISRDVKMTTLTPSVAWRPVRSFEAAFGVGVMWFSGPSFDSFTRVFVQPIQVDVKPLAAINQLRGADAVWWDELLSLRAGITIVPRGFDATDFGAIPGTFRVSRDTLNTAAVFLDLESLVMKLRRAPKGYRPSRPRGGN